MNAENFTWGDLLRLNQYDKQEAVKIALQWISSPKIRQSKYPTIKPDPHEYNLAVSLWESGHRETAIGLIQMLALHPNQLSAASVKSLSEDSGLAKLRLVSAAKGKKLPDINVWVKVFNTGIFRCDPVAPHDREEGQHWINPGDTYEGPVYLPNLAVWIRNGKMMQLRGV